MRRRIWRRPTAGILNSAWTPFGTSGARASPPSLMSPKVPNFSGRRVPIVAIADAAVLLLDVAVPLELLRADAVGDADQVPEARQRLGAGRVLVLAGRRRRELRRGPRRRGPGTPRRPPGRARAPRFGHGHVARGSGLFSRRDFLSRFSSWSLTGSGSAAHRHLRRLPPRTLQTTAFRRVGGRGAQSFRERPARHDRSGAGRFQLRRNCAAQQWQAQTARWDFRCCSGGVKPSRRPREVSARQRLNSPPPARIAGLFAM